MKNLLLVLFLVILVLTACVLPDDYAIGDIGQGGGVVFDVDYSGYLEYIILEGEEKNWEYANRTAGYYTGGGYDNWHLPTKGELDDIYENLYENGRLQATSKYYWSSSVNSILIFSWAWAQRFSDGTTIKDSQYNDNYVLVVRGWF